MLRLFVRRSNDVNYFTDDRALELENLRDGGPGWWLRGEGDTRDARSVGRVFSTTDRSAVQGYDIVIAAPRPISILVALDPSQAPGVVAAHRESVAATMHYLEQRALVVRDRRAGGDREVPARWERIVSYTHGLNRHGEPHLHDHVLVGARPERSSNVLDSRSLFAHVTAADALYRASLRHELSRRTSWSAWRSFAGTEHVQGLDEGYRALWGGHHQGRGEKLAWRREETIDRWRRDESRFVAHGTLEAPRRSRAALDEHAFGASLEGPREVTRRHLVLAWANAATFGVAPREMNASLDRLYPELSDSRGVRECSIGVTQARMTRDVRERGPRPLDAQELTTWVQRSRERSGAWSERSR